ncbi:hypothetical protein BH11PLA2_BH11PLA2_40690 [soil metagenome]
MFRSLFFTVILAGPLAALTPEQIYIVINTNVPDSRVLADYYAKARNVPAENIIPLKLPMTEEMTRDEYDRFLAEPLREALKAKGDKVQCLLCMYGVPLRVGPKTPNAGEKAEIARLTDIRKETSPRTVSGDPKVAAAAVSELAHLDADLMKLEHRESTAAVDSELMLVRWSNYPLARWVLNPLHWQTSERVRKANPPVLMTARLDGPTPAIVKRLINDAIAVEAVGLQGKAYIDARGIPFDLKNTKENGGYGYGGYDESMRETAALLTAKKLTVTLDNKPELFPPNSCPETALYCGWYSHGKYIDSCTFVKGAVAWHLASSEAITLRKPESTVWCPNLLKAGVAVTLGPVAEPYTVAFPKPAEFFGFLLTGKYTLAEVNARTTTFASWMMTCIGDPLYNPYKKTPLMTDREIEYSPKSGKTLFR